MRQPKPLGVGSADKEVSRAGLQGKPSGPRPPGAAFCRSRVGGAEDGPGIIVLVCIALLVTFPVLQGGVESVRPGLGRGPAAPRARSPAVLALALAGPGPASWPSLRHSGCQASRQRQHWTRKLWSRSSSWPSQRHSWHEPVTQRWGFHPVTEGLARQHSHESSLILKVNN
jgi:hypothetical protein